MLLFLSALALAQTPDLDSPPEPVIQYAQRTEVEFGEHAIEVGILRPPNALVLERKRAAFNPMIRLRTDFADLMDQDVAQVR